MQIITKAHKQFLLSLVEMNVDFLLIGGYAVIYHGYPRLTMDMDIWLKPDNGNKLKLLPALRSYGIVEEDLEKIKNSDFTKPLAFYIGEKKNKIDFLTVIAGVTYDEADAKKVFLQINNIKIPVIDYNDLVVNKMIVGRP
jgi:DNA-directed RNA polymerase subunit H (RpoH/RPB5)